MKRDIYEELLNWKSSNRRKPLLLKGARQTGKTYILKEFGRNEYNSVLYFNFEEDASLDDFFNKNLDPHRIIEDLGLYRRSEIHPGRDLIIFDEIQASNNALNSLKYFQENVNEFHIAAAGSLLGVKLSVPKSFPVGKVNFLDLYPLNFFEFLDATGESRYRKLLSELSQPLPLPQAFHEDLVDILKKYYFTGGMPEAVKEYVQSRDFSTVRAIQKEIINAYILDFAKHAPASDIPKLSLIWDSIPSHLARENKKFMFSAVKKGARARGYESALQWLEDTGLIYKAFSVSVAKYPLKGYMDRSCFKVYALDVGLLGAMAGIPVDVLAHGNKLFKEYAGAFVENYAAQQLVQISGLPLFYWRSEGKMAEVDFLYEGNGKIYPLEVKSGINPKSKSLKSFDTQFQPPALIRTTLLNLKRDGRTYNIPLYALPCLRTMLAD